MKKTNFLIAVIMIVLFSSCTNEVKSELIITGDVQNEIVLNDYENSVTDILEKADVLNEDYFIVISSFDGVMATINYDELTDAKIIYTDENKWQFVSEHHPRQAGVKNIEYIVVVANSVLEEQNALRILSEFGSFSVSYGGLFLLDKNVISISYDSAKKNDYEVQPITKLEVIPLSYWMPNAYDVIAYCGDGSEHMVSPEGFIEWRGNTVDYIAPNGKDRIPHIIGLWEDYPELSVSHVVRDIKNTQGNVLLIELDGLGYDAFYTHNFEYLQQWPVFEMRTVMPSISNVALASIITGETPNNTGVKVRGDRVVAVDDIFATKDGIVIEGFSKLIEMSVDQILNADSNGNGSTDDEVFESAKKALVENKELTFVHFHGLDDVSHTYGPFSSEAAAKSIELDGYVKELAKDFDGTVIVVSDHGQYDSAGDKKGCHGTFVREAMLVPYIYFEPNYEF